MYFLIHPLVWINDERMAVHCLESGCIGLYIPSDLEISLGPRDVPRASPSGHLSGLGKSLGRRGCTTQYIPPLGSVRIHSLIISREVLILTLSIFNALNVCISWYSLCPRECTEKYFPRECISRTLPRENIGDTSSRGKHWQCPGNDESSSLMICRRQAKCQDNGCNEKINTWTL